MMKIKTKTILASCLFLLVLTSFRFIWLHHYNASELPKAEKGILDLRKWDKLGSKTINLDGEWKFYPEALVTPEDQDHERGSFLTVPGNWKSFFPDSKYKGHGYGTYYLKILVPKNNRHYAIRAPSIRTASRLFVNGQEIAINGTPSTKPDTHRGDPFPITSELKATPNGEIELLIQVSNFDHLSYGGIAKSIKFGNTHAVSKTFHISALWQFIVFVIMMIHSLYALILYYLRPRKKELLYFALGVLFLSISVIMDDDRLLLNAIPLNYEWYLKLIKVAYIGTTGFLLQFVQHMFCKANKSKILSYLSYLCAASGIITLFVPLNYLFFTEYNYIILFISYSAIAVITYKFILSKERDGLLILLAAISILSSLGWGVIKSQVPSYFPVYYPFDLILAIVLFSTFWFRKFFQESEEKDDLTIKLQEEDKRKDQFLANTSHELRNPLHGIINIAQGVIENKKVPLDDKSRQDLELLILIGQRMSHLINDLMDVQLLKERRIRLQTQKVDIQTIASSVIDMVRFMTGNKNIQFTLNVPDKFPAIAADKNRLVQILLNLLHNSVKYTDEGVISIWVEEKNGMACVHVEDTGSGIEKDMQKDIFSPYKQINVATDSMRGGLGLGLSICKELIELHGGIIKVESIPGKGADFSFTLPFADNPYEQFVDFHHKESAAARNETFLTDFTLSKSSDIENWIGNKKSNILAVDDDPVNLRLMSRILPKEDYNVLTELNAERALKLLDLKEWDLIILDVMMPKMSGYELTRQIRKKYSISELPILLLTARNQPADVISGYLSGANDYVTKPVDRLELRARVKVLTDLRQSINEQLSMEAAWLQAQIQPHFLYNTLNTIVSLSDIDSGRMTSLLQEFGNYLQKSFNPKNLQRLVPLKHELSLLKSYLYIEKERFGDRLSVKWEVSENINLSIPPLTIQPLVENAIRHGILKRDNGGTIQIRINDKEKCMEFEIRDDGVGMDDEELKQVLSSRYGNSSGVGLANTNRRLIKLYGKGLKIHSIVNKGTSITFEIPKAS